MINFNVKTPNDHDRQIIKKDVSLVEKSVQIYQQQIHSEEKPIQSNKHIHWIIENVAILEVNVSTTSY